MPTAHADLKIPENETPTDEQMRAVLDFLANDPEHQARLAAEQRQQ